MIKTTLIITEKPSVCASVALAVGATKKRSGYWEGNGFFVSHAFGHLYMLCDTKDYNKEMEHWDLKDYPFIPKKFMYKAIDNPGTLKQISILKDLIDKSDMVINGCDQDREGGVIYSEIANALGITKPMKRLWIKANTPKAVLEGMENLTEIPINQELAGYCRQQLDWIFGINFTTCFSLLCGGTTIKLGRIIVCTLKLIFDREVAISNFISEPFYMIKSTFIAEDNETYIGTYFTEDESKLVTKFVNKEQLLIIQESIKNRTGTIIKKEGKKSNENPSKLFSLTDLQGYITKNYNGITSNGVLDIMQSLYEKKYLTYPRTPSNYLDDSQTKEAEESLYAVLDIPELNIKNKSDVKFHSEKRVFDSSKVDSHPAIMPTYIVPDLTTLSDQEKIVYIEVTKRFVSQFMPAAVYDVLEMVTKVEEYEFSTKGKALIEEGWKQLYINLADTNENIGESDQEEDQEDNIKAKNIKLGDTVTTGNIELRETKTKPQAHYTEASLLISMKTCGKDVENEEEILKGYTIGTASTRGETIKKLIECGYITQKGKNLLITELGTKVIHYFPIKRLLRTDFTGQIEKTLKDIENGKYDSKVFMERMTDYMVKNIEELKKCEIPQIIKPVSPDSIVGICPKCGKTVIENEKAFSCEATRNNDCNFTLWKEDKFWSTFGKEITTSMAKEFITKMKITLKGLKSTKKEGVTFDAVVILFENKETNYWNFKLDFDSLPKKKSTSNFKSKTPHVTKFKQS